MQNLSVCCRDYTEEQHSARIHNGLVWIQMKKRHWQKIRKWGRLKLQEPAAERGVAQTETTPPSRLDALIALVRPAQNGAGRLWQGSVPRYRSNRNKEFWCSLTTASAVFLHLIPQESELDDKKICCFLLWSVKSIFSCISSWYQTYQVETIRLV